MRGSASTSSAFTGALFVVAFFTTMIAAWATHVVVSIQTASWVLLVVGSLFFPIGIIHGFIVWLS